MIEADGTASTVEGGGAAETSVTPGGAQGRSVLYVGGDSPHRRALVRALQLAGIDVHEAAGAEAGWEGFRRARPDLVVSDLYSAQRDGLRLVVQIRRESDRPILVVATRALLPDAVSAMQAGATDFVDLEEAGTQGLLERISGLLTSAGIISEEGAFDDRIVGGSTAIERVRSRLRGLAPLSTPVLVVGEPGTGRDLAVRMLHRLGSSRHGRLRIVHCAHDEAPGCLDDVAAVYLDGVESLSGRVGAQWADLMARMKEEDSAQRIRIFASARPAYRLHAEGPEPDHLRPLLLRFPVELPPLRERPEDVGAIADHLVQRIARGVGRPAVLSQASRRLLAERHWPRNVRQLEQVLERAVAFSSARTITRELVEEVLDDLEESLDAIRRRHCARERDDLLDALRYTGGNVSRAADRLGRSRGAVYRLIEKHGILLSQAR